MSDNNKQPEGFFYQPNVIAWILRIFYFLCVAVLVADVFVHRHILTDIEKITGFYAWYGLGACVILVLLASQMRKLVIRDEDYYVKHEEDIHSSNKESDEVGKHD